MRITLRDMQRIAIGIERDDFSSLTRGVLGIRTLEAALDLSMLHQMQILIWEWLVHLGCITDLQRRAIIKMEEVVGVSTALEEAGARHEMPISRLGIAEYRYAFWNVSELWLDFKHEERMEALPEPAVTTVVCDATALYLRARDRLSRIGAVSQED